MVHAIIETKKSHHLPSASQRPRKASGVIPVQVWRSENQGSWWYRTQFEGRRTPYPSSNRQAGSEFLLLLCFFFTSAFNGLNDTHPQRREQSTESPVQMLISSRNTPIDIPRNSLIWVPQDMVKLTHKSNYHNKQLGYLYILFMFITYKCYIFLLIRKNSIISISVHVSWCTYARFSVRYTPGHGIHRS